MPSHKSARSGSLAAVLSAALAGALTAGCGEHHASDSSGVDAAATTPTGDDRLGPRGPATPGASIYSFVDDAPSVVVRIVRTGHPGGNLVDEKRVVKLVREQFRLDDPDTPYYKVDVRVLYDDADAPEYLVVYLRHRATYQLDVARVLLADDYAVMAVEPHYVQTAWDLGQDPAYTEKSACPDTSVQMVFATETTEFSSAVDGVQRAGEYAEAAGFNTVTLFGYDASLTAYKNWLSCDGLLVLGNIGHGSETGIMLSGGTLDYSYFNSLDSDALVPMILYFNSCDVHNPPLETSILGAGASRFIGGDIPLDVGPSEATFKCFWQEALATFGPVEPILTTCEQQNYYPPGAHGISGNGPLPWGFDGATCTEDSFCDSGFCVDGVCCSTACDASCMACNVPGSLGQCVQAPNDTPCPDGDACNGEEICQNGTCLAGSAPDCSTANPCTNDYCDAVEGCKHDPVTAGTPCPDDDLCNGEETCLEGTCRAAAEPTDCDDLNECTVDTCDRSQGCQHQAVADDTDCGGGVCGEASCLDGLCVPLDSSQCDDGDPCTGDSCHPEVGCVNTTLEDGSVCGMCQVCTQGVCGKEPGCVVMGVMACNISGSVRGAARTTSWMGPLLLLCFALPLLRRSSGRRSTAPRRTERNAA